MQLRTATHLAKLLAAPAAAICLVLPAERAIAQAGAASGPAFAAPPVPQAANAGVGAAGASAIAPLEASQIVARIDGQVVQACDILWQVNQIVEENLARVPPEHRATVKPEDVEKLREAVMRQMIGSLVDLKLIMADFHRNVPPERWADIEKTLAEPFEEQHLPRMMESFQVSSRAELARALFERGSSLDDMRRMFNEQTIARQWLDVQVKFDKEVTHDEMRAYYEEHAAEYEYPTQVRWEELMVRPSEFKTREEAIAALCAMGNEVIQRAAQHPDFRGPAFAEIARQRSHGITASEGGQHGWTTQGALKSKAIDEALFTHQVGQMSDLLFSELGIHIVRVLERKEAGRTPFTEVQAAIREKIREERAQEARQEYLDELRKDARIWTVYTGSVTWEQLAQPPADAVQR